MQVFPETPAPSYPLVITPEWKTLISPFETGGEQRRSLWLFPKYNVTVKYDGISKANSDILWAFYMARKGAGEAFYFYDRDASPHLAHYVATGDGATLTFDIPGRSTSSRTLYGNGSVISSGVTYLVGGGDGNSDRVQLSIAPTLGTIITISFTGFLRVKCRFEVDELDKETFTYLLYRYGIKLKGVK